MQIRRLPFRDKPGKARDEYMTDEAREKGVVVVLGGTAVERHRRANVSWPIKTLSNSATTSADILFPRLLHLTSNP